MLRNYLFAEIQRFFRWEMELLRRDTDTAASRSMRNIFSAWPPIKVEDVEFDNLESVVVVMNPVLKVGRILGFPFGIKFRWLSLRTAWLAIFLSFGASLTLFTILDNLSDIKVAFLGAISFYLLGSAYQFYFLWLSLTWPRLMENWLAVEKRMAGLPRVHINTAVTTVAISYIIVGLCEHSFSILDNLRQVKVRCAGSGLSSLELYYRVHYVALFKYTDYAVWKGALTSFVILTLTVLWTFTDVFIITISMSLAARFRQLKLALQQVKGKDMPKDFWKGAREIYLELTFLTREVDSKISLLFFLTLVNNVYTAILMLLNSLSMKTNQDYLQSAYYMICCTFVVMRLVGDCLAASKINEHSKSVLPLLFAVPSTSYCLEVHRFLLHAWYDPMALTACNFFSITRSTILKIAGTILTYEIVLIQFNMLNVDEKNRRPKAECPLIQALNNMHNVTSFIDF